MMISLKMLYHNKFRDQDLLFDVHLCVFHEIYVGLLLFKITFMELGMFVDISSTGSHSVDCL
jgi:hypothetical protein